MRKCICGSTRWIVGIDCVADHIVDGNGTILEHHPDSGLSLIEKKADPKEEWRCYKCGETYED